MEKMKIKSLEDSSEGFKLISKGKYPAICLLNHIRFHDTEPMVNMEIDWICKGGYSNLQRKKMVQRTINGLLRYIVRSERQRQRKEKST